MRIRNFKKWIDCNGLMILKNHIESFRFIDNGDDTYFLYLNMRSGKNNEIRFTSEELNLFYEYMRIEE